MHSNATGSYGSKMIAASREQAKSVAGVRSSSFYDGDSGPSYSFASESPLLNKLSCTLCVDVFDAFV